MASTPDRGSTPRVWGVPDPRRDAARVGRARAGGGSQGRAQTAAIFAALLALGPGVALATTYAVESLVTDDQAALEAAGFEPAAFVDPNLINPWGISFSPTGPFWVSNQGSATSTLYDGTGAPQSLIVDIPQVGPVAGPTGQVYNPTTSFVLASGDPGVFFFANLDGSISGWNDGEVAEVVVAASDDRPAVYTGLALASTGGSDYLYAANNETGRIDVFDAGFNAVSLPGGFVDPGPNPDGLVPFNVQAIGGLIYVTYAVGGPAADEAPLGTGFVSVFDADGAFVGRLVEGGQVVSPWGVAMAPDGFGEFSGALLVGNFHEEFGYINAFDPDTGEFLGSLSDGSGDPLNIPYLWGLLFGNGGSGGDVEDLYFAAGIGDELHGLFGEIAPVPLPAGLPLLACALGAIAAFARRRGRTAES
jgi:uncharacterized protein (TIGR03118 family)